VPILDHDGFRVYETAAIAAYVDEASTGPVLQPANARERARMNQWISALAAPAWKCSSRARSMRTTAPQHVTLL
jgi:glutathione S-transferase